jgi:class 3 adenylate cyclase
VNTASRLESFDKSVTAPAGFEACRILIGGSTLRYLRGRVAVKSLGAISLKGKAELIEVFLITGEAEAALNPALQEMER